MADHELGGGGIRVVLGNAVERTAVERKAVVSVDDAPFLGVQLDQKNHTLQHLLWRCVDGFNSKRSIATLALVEELGDCSLSRRLLDAREHLVPRLAVAKYVQRQALLVVRRNVDEAGNRCCLYASTQSHSNRRISA